MSDAEVIPITESGKFGVDELGTPTVDENGDFTTTPVESNTSEPAINEIPDPTPEGMSSGEEDSFGIDEDAEAAFALEEAKAQEESGEDPELEGLEDVGQRAQSRIRNLIEEKKNLQNQLGQFQQTAQQYFRQSQQQTSNLVNQLNQSRQQLAALKAEVRTIREVGLPRQKEVDPQQSVLDEFQQATIDKAKELLHPEVKKVQDEFQQYKQQVENEKREYQTRMKQQRISQTADHLVDNVLLPKGFPPEILQARPTGDITLHQWLGNKILSEAYSRRCTPEQAAQKLLPFYKQVGLGIMRAHAAARKGVAPSQKTTAPPQKRPFAKSAPKEITKKDAEAAGFKDQLEAAMAKKGLIGA